MGKAKFPKLKPIEWFVIILGTAVFCYFIYLLYEKITEEDPTPTDIPESIQSVLEWTKCNVSKCGSELSVVANLQDKGDMSAAIIAAFEYGKCACTKCPEFIDNRSLPNGFTKEDCLIFNTPPSSRERNQSAIKKYPRSKIYDRKFKRDLKYFREMKSKKVKLKKK